jgi:tetratricopeptide (TPR) repeat protein
MRTVRGVLPLALLLPLALPAAAQETVEDKLRPSVVQIDNDECYGSGMFVDADGLILTNAHVACSPLPYRVHALAKVNGRFREVTFTSVKLLGFHPEYDLALLRIDPSETGSTIRPVTLAKSAPVPGERVWAIGFPSDHDRGKAKVATWGEMRTPNSDFYGMPYIAADISVTHGNSGGPLCNESGEVLGVVTAFVEKGALAVPISAMRPERFGPLKGRLPNRTVSSKLLEMAEEELKQSNGGAPTAQAMSYFETALLWDSGNAALYSRVGQLNLLVGRHAAAVAYLTRSLQMEPWPEKAETYRSLGMALGALHRGDEALAVWREGLVKFPLDNAELWGDIAAALEKEKHPLEAAFSARVALQTFSGHAKEMNELYGRCRAALDPADVNRLREMEGDLNSHLGRLRASADKARRDGQAFMLPDAAKIIATMAGVQREAAGGDPDQVVPRGSRETPKIPDAELDARFIRGRIEVAKEYLRNGKAGKAEEILEDVVKTFPSHPETESARLALKLLRRN